MNVVNEEDRLIASLQGRKVTATEAREVFMKIKEDFVLRKVADSYVVVPVNKLTLDFNGIINLNETGAFLFEKLQNDCEKADLLKAMLDEYEVSEQKASADIDSFIKKLEEADVLE